MIARIGWYLLFLIVFAVYFILVAFSQKGQEKLLTSKKGSAFLWNQLSIAVGMIPLVVIPWVLAGFFNRSFTLLILVVFEASALLLYLAFYIFRVTPRLVGMRYVLWAAEVTMKHPVLALIVLGVFGVVVLGGYFMVATYVYFANPLHSAPAVRQVLTMNIGLFLIGTLFASGSSMALVASPQVNDRTRQAIFLGQAASALPLGAILTVYLALMGIGGERFVPHSFTLRPAVSQYVPLFVLTVFYMVVLVVPYFIGLEGRRRAEISAYNAILDRITRIIDAVGIPSSRDLAQANELHQAFDKETEEWLANEPIARVANLIELNNGKVDEKLQGLVEPYRAFKDQDLRFIFLATVRNLDAKLAEVIEELGQFSSAAYRTEVYIKLFGAIESHFKDQRQIYENKLKAAEERKVLVPVFARLVAVLGAAPVVFQYAQKLINILPHAQ